MHLPEQGISGPFRITAIKHLLPQKRPEEENLLPGFAFRPVTGIFAHRSADVLSVALESGDTLGVTSAHPVYSLTYGSWRLAGELEHGEEVLAYEGSSRVASVAPLPGAHTVYNLEVKDWHNFLVGEFGVVVHNSCITWVTKQAIQEAIQFQNLRNALINNQVYIPDNWIRNTNIQNGIKYVDPSNSGKYIRMQKEGGATAVGKPWHGKPYYRVADGTYPGGLPKYLDASGMPSPDPLKTHFIINEIAKFTD